MTNFADMMPFSKLMGIKVTDASKDKVSGTLIVRPDLCTAGGILHGGAMMAFADSLGGIGAFMALPDGATQTTTIESKTNFLAAVKEGETVYAETVPISIGRRVSVWQTTVIREDGKVAGFITQSQMVL